MQNSIWWIEYLGLQGIRLDTLPYPEKDFVAEWSRRIMAEYPAFSIVGEEWSELPAVTSYWQAGKQNSDGFATHMSSVFDFPVQSEMAWALTGDPASVNGVWVNLYETVAQDFLYPEPMNLLIFPGNHDMDRIFTRLEEQLDLFKMAMVYVATMRGIPQFFYADEILASHVGTSSHGVLRSDFPGGWEGDTVNAFTGSGLDEQQLEAQDFVRRLLNWRKDNPVIHHGDFMHFAPIRNVYVYFRYDDAGTVMVILNRDEEPVELDLARFAERLGNATSATDVMGGEQRRTRRIDFPRTTLCAGSRTGVALDRYYASGRAYPAAARRYPPGRAFGEYERHELISGALTHPHHDRRTVTLTPIDDSAFEVHYREAGVEQLPSFAIDSHDSTPVEARTVRTQRYAIVFEIEGLTAIVDKVPGPGAVFEGRPAARRRGTRLLPSRDHARHSFFPR